MMVDTVVINCRTSPRRSSAASTILAKRRFVPSAVESSSLAGCATTRPATTRLIDMQQRKCFVCTALPCSQLASFVRAKNATDVSLQNTTVVPVDSSAMLKSQFSTARTVACVVWAKGLVSTTSIATSAARASILAYLTIMSVWKTRCTVIVQSVLSTCSPL